MAEFQARNGERAELRLVQNNNCCPNEFKTNETLKDLYTHFLETDMSDPTAHLLLCGRLYEMLVNDHFIALHNHDTNALWSVLTLLTYYILGFLKQQQATNHASGQNVAAIRVPEAIVSKWRELLGIIQDRLGRPISWFDLLYANNYHRDGERGIQPIFLLNGEVEREFTRTLIRLGGSNKENVPGRFEEVKGHLNDTLFYKYYQVSIELFELISPPITGLLKGISRAFPDGLEVLNEHYPIPEMA